MGVSPDEGLSDALTAITTSARLDYTYFCNSLTATEQAQSDVQISHESNTSSSNERVLLYARDSWGVSGEGEVVGGGCAGGAVGCVDG